MDFKEKVILLLGNKTDFDKQAGYYFNIKHLVVKIAIDDIIDNAITAITFQCSYNNKFNEIFRIAKECAALNFNDILRVQPDILYKGKGANSEIFGINLVFIINEIADKNKLKNGVINTLIALITPAVLSSIYNVSIENRYTPNQLCNYLQAIQKQRELFNSQTLQPLHYTNYQLAENMA